jgi:hypothetical protein
MEGSQNFFVAFYLYCQINGWPSPFVIVFCNVRKKRLFRVSSFEQVVIYASKDSHLYQVHGRMKFVFSERNQLLMT